MGTKAVRDTILLTRNNASTEYYNEIPSTFKDKHTTDLSQDRTRSHTLKGKHTTY